MNAEGLAPGFGPQVEAFLRSEEGARLQGFLALRRAAGATIYPPDPLRALRDVALADVRVVILGQDPYHGEGQAHGLAFSVPAGVRLPPSLRNIDAELQADCGCAPLACGDLSGWSRQGVLLLNAVMTVERDRPGSHAGRGWEALSGALLAALAADPVPRAFLLWGAWAQARLPAAPPRHLVLAANHPSPLSARRPPRPFLGCRHFSQANAFLAAHGRAPIDWCRAGR